MKENTKKTILITGGAGFIGSAVIMQLQDTYKIICLGKGDSFAKLKKFVNKNVVFVKGDISNEKVVARHVKTADIIIHLAGGGGNAACVENPIWALKTHIEGTYFLAQQAAKRRIKKFIFASSYLVYGAAARGAKAVAETTTPKPANFYANLKIFAEQVIVDSGVNYTIMRFANIYGCSPLCRLQSDGAINNFIRACLEGKDIQVRGSGKQTIDYFHIQDAVQAITAALKKGPRKSVYNIGSGSVITVQELAKTARNVYRKLYGKNTSIKNRQHSERSNPGAARMSIQKARKDLAWRPTVNLETGITELMHKNKAI